MTTPTPSTDERSAAPLLTYSTASPRRWPRILIILSLLLSLSLTAYLTYPRVSRWYYRREGLRNVQAWYQLARTHTLPPNTLLYTENPADFVNRRPVTSTSGGRSWQSISFGDQYPAHRQVGYTSYGAPIAHPFNVIYVHEHLAWDTQSPTGSSPQLVTVSYFSSNPDGSPNFNAMIYKPITQISFNFHGGACTASPPPDRPLTNLRLYAGQPHPSDRSKFSIPFSCDSGRGTFDFQIDTDASDGGRLTPAVSITWSSAPATQETRSLAPLMPDCLAQLAQQ